VKELAVSLIAVFVTFAHIISMARQKNETTPRIRLRYNGSRWNMPCLREKNNTYRNSM
jgi:hypothetical protein